MRLALGPIVLSSLWLVACAPAQRTAPALTTAAPTEIPMPQIVAQPALRKLVEDEHMGGTVARWREGSEVIECGDVALCQRRFAPQSTFKVANAMIGLETGVIPDADFVIPWDGVTRDIPEWNRDHTLRSGIRFSVVPYYQELARRVGPERMAAWVQRLGFGNAEIGTVVDRFWLDGPLAISPVEQLAFWRRLAHGELPVSHRTLEIVRDIVVLERRGEATLRGKTGWGDPGGPSESGWFVGYVERGTERAYVAVLLFPPRDRASETFQVVRRRIGERALTDLAMW